MTRGLTGQIERSRAARAQRQAEADTYHARRLRLEAERIFGVGLAHAEVDHVEFLRERLPVIRVDGAPVTLPDLPEPPALGQGLRVLPHCPACGQVREPPLWLDLWGGHFTCLADYATAVECMRVRPCLSCLLTAPIRWLAGKEDR